MLHVWLFNRALIADELSQDLIFFPAVPGFRRLRKLAQKHFSACVSLCFMLAFVFPSLSISSPKICVFSAFGSLQWFCLRCSVLCVCVCVCVCVSLSKRCVVKYTAACGESVEQGFHSKSALWSVLVTSLIIYCMSVGFRAIRNMLSAQIKWFIYFPSGLYPVPWAFHLFVTGCIVCCITL